tara:strand:- start:9644 stop:10594 length:951 start_codon:yes stop_codon:yes gene_type:complete
MIFKKPLFWNLKKPNFFSYLLIPFTIPLIINNLLIKTQKKTKNLKIKSVCVGNIYLGGTGKTPLAIRLYEIILKMGFKAVTAKKFYRNQIDEQALLQKKTQSIISKQRIDAINKAADQGNDVIIFDDGLQERRVDYDLKIVCFKKKNWIGNGQLIPSGPLREKIESLKKYDVVFLNGKEDNSDYIRNKIQKINPQIKIFNTYYKIKNSSKFDISANYLIFSGIGDPSSFKEILLDNNVKVTKEIIYPDHYNYKKSDIKKIINEAKKLNANILTTEKDFVKISNYDTEKVNFLEIELKIYEEESFIKFIYEKLKEKN